MTAFTDNQKRAVGAAYVLSLLSPSSPYGRTAAKEIAPYDVTEGRLLARELDNVEKAASAGFSRLNAILEKFRDVRGSVRKLGSAGLSLSEVELFELKGFLLSLAELAESFAGFNHDAELAGIEISGMDAALGILDPERGRSRSFHVSDLYSERLARIRFEKKAAETRLNAAKTRGLPAQVISRLENERREIAAREEEEERAVRLVLTELLAPHKPAFESAALNIARLDLTLAKAALSRTYGLAKPAIADKAITITRMYHPEVRKALKARGGDMTPVSLALSPGTAVVTGANMGGKSVALKTLVLNVFLFQCGLHVFAEGFAAPLFDSVDFIFDDEQSYLTGLSSFGAEVSKLNGIIERAGKGFSLVVLDEPAKGTNPREGRAFVSALAELLNGFPSISIMATHYDDVAKENYRRYMSAGLRRDMIENAKPGRISPEDIGRYIDYRLIETPRGAEVPKDASAICRLLNLNPRLLQMMEAELNDGD